MLSISVDVLSVILVGLLIVGKRPLDVSMFSSICTLGSVVSCSKFILKSPANSIFPERLDKFFSKLLIADSVE